MANDRSGGALVTGGGRRIGRAIALALADAGYRVVVHANTSRGPAEETCQEIVKRGGTASVVLADLAQHDDVLKLVPAAAAFGPLHLLVNNASEFEHDELGSLDRTRFDRAFDINLRAPLFLTEAFAKQLPQGAHGCVVNILDQRVLKPTPRFVSYSLSKSALYTATTMMAQALAPAIRVNAVAPGPVLPSPRQTEADFARQAATLPLAKGATPEEVAQAVVYLASAASVTGQTISVDGGQHIAWRTPDAEIAE